jgi:Arc/MetJ-type ribon-helix-helix transcriptional regulator
MHNLQDLVEHGPHQDRGEFIRMLLDLWRGKTLMDIATEVATFVYEDAAEDDLDAEELAEEERLMVPPSPGKPVPKDLLEPKTLLDAVRRLEMDLERSGNEDRARCAGQVRCRLLSGNIHTVAKELTDLAEEAAQTWDRLIDGDDDDEEDEDE